MPSWVVWMVTGEFLGSGRRPGDPVLMFTPGWKLATMQMNHEKAAAEQAKAAADLSLKAIQAVSTSNAKITVQPATLNCG